MPLAPAPAHEHPAAIGSDAVNGPSSLGAQAGPLLAALPGAQPSAARSGLPDARNDSSIESQASDFSSILSLLAGASPGPAVMATLPASSASPFSRAGPMVAGTGPPRPQSMLQILPAGGSFAPLRGKLLPSAGLPTTVPARSADAGQLTAFAALVSSRDSPASGVLPAAPATVAPLPATAQAAVFAPWLRSLLTGEQPATNGELLPAAPGDALTAGDPLIAHGGGSRGTSQPTAVVLPTTPSQQPVFEQALGERLAWLVQEGRHDARIKLHPAELGSIDIRLSVDGEATRVSLSSPHAAVRDALEQALPRLRELLGHGGFDLSQVDIGAGDARSHGDFGRGALPSVTGPDFAAVADEAEPVALHVALRLPQGLVDTFA